MLNNIISFSLRNRFSVVVGAVLILFSGIYILYRMEIDIFPELTAPTVVVMTEAGGLAPEEIEKLVTFPIETSVNGATSVRRIRSNSSMGFSLVFVEFDWNTDIYKARQTVSERLVQVSERLPGWIDKPVIAPQTSLLGEMMIIAIQSDSLDMMELRSYADWTVVPRLLSIGGVAQVNVIGGDSKEYQILADPNKMNFYNVTLNDLAEACNDININNSGGFINQYGNKYVIRGIVGTDNPYDIGNSLIKNDAGKIIRIKDIADVRTGSAPKIGTGSYMGEDAVLVTITRQPDANTVKLSGNISEALSELRENSKDAVDFHSDIYNQASFIRTSIRNVLRALIEGGIFVIIILYLFLYNIRTTVISMLSIPLSLLVTTIMLKAFGFTINTMSLGGMAIAIGSLVDDAIIDVDNIYKRLKQNILLPPEQREKVLTVVYNASVEMRSSIWNATMIIILTFVPLLMLEGLEARMLRPLGISFILSLFASLIVAISLTPVLSSFLLTDEKRLLRASEGSWTEKNIKRIYHRALRFTLDRNRTVIISTVFLFILSLVLLFTSGRSFLPPFNEGALTVNITSLPGISLEESTKIGLEAQKLLLQIPEVKSISCKTGRAELAEHSFGENVSELDVPFILEDRSREEFFNDVRNRLKKLPGISVEVGQPITHRIDNMLSGTKANVAIKLYGDNLNEMFMIANNVKSAISGIKGIGDLNVEQLIESPQIKIKPKREMLARFGIDINSFNAVIRYGIGGQTVSEVFEDEKRFPLVLRFDDKTRNSIESIRNLLVDTRSNTRIPLHYVAEVESSAGPYSINRENVKRKIVVSVNTEGADVGGVVRDIKNTIKQNIVLPDGYRIEYAGQFESAESASSRLLVTSLIALLFIFIILFQEFHDTSVALIILLNLPLALIGGIFAVKLSSNVVSIPSIIGFITLFGIATRNGILLVSNYIQLQQKNIGLHESVVSGSVDRLNPILMTALTAALALIPLAVGGDKPGNEIQSPMATVILGGLLSSTLLNIFVIPSVYYMLKSGRNKGNH